ncbi:MAG: Asp-tRNA(Asn)/Glu-tRNA(Gln) amidotransferase subunit GatA [Clostridia bacterium]|nr:Asp-tRNA(Asn)/Glu-tRNA(Gln) amidotransferase subunit GatA [Clostridia bacterium]
MENLTVDKAVKLLKSGEITSRQLCEKCIENYENQKDLNTLISNRFEEALKEADLIDERRKNGEELPDLAGIPYFLKDNINYLGTNTTCASLMLKDYKSAYDATLVKCLKRDGAICLGKTNMDEFAMGSSNENSKFGPVRNPNNKDYVPGGSSGGSVAGVKANQCLFAIGSETGGSIRQPSALCGTYGLKTTYGLVPRYGVVAFASSFDQAGPVANSAKDLAYVLNSISCYDENEVTSAKVDRPNYLDSFTNSIKGKRIGIDKQFFTDALDKEVNDRIQEVIKFYKDNGAELVEIDLKNIKYSLPVYYMLTSAEASSNLARFDGIRYGARHQTNDLDELYLKSRKFIGQEAKRRILIGSFVLSGENYKKYYKKAKAVQALLKNDFDEAFKKCDCIISPTSPTVAFKIGEKVEDAYKMYLSDIYTVPVNTVGVPAINIPCGKNSQGLPIGFQLIGNKFSEPLLLNMADFYENNAKENN